MLKGILVCEGDGITKNIGDHIQSIAAKQFLDSFDDYVERENLDSYDKHNNIKVVMNAWYMHNPKRFPPSDNIKPLLTSVHIVPTIAEQMLSKASIEYFKKYEPIGCRDFATQKLLASKGIESYFSSCLTLTLGYGYKKYKSESPKQVIFVDPYFETFRNSDGKFLVTQTATSIAGLLKHRNKIKKLSRKAYFESDVNAKAHKKEKTSKEKLKRLLHISAFYQAYSKLFEDDVLFEAEYLSHQIVQSDYPSNDSKMQLSDDLMKKYADSKLVVTSRIHTALPCIAVETPTIFVNSDNLSSSSNPIRSPGRFGGLIELLNVANYFSDEGGSVVFDQVEGKIGKDTVIVNEESYKEFAKKLQQDVQEFFLD